MSVSAKVIIAGQNNISSAVKGARNDLSTLAWASQKVGDTLKKAFTVTAIVASLKKLGSACTDCFNDFSTATRSYKQLALALKDNSGYKSVVANIDKLSRMTLESKDQVESMVSQLAALGKSSDEINKISDAAVALSNVTGKGLNSSMTILMNTYTGNVKQLRKLGINTNDLTETQLKNGAAVDLVIKKFYSLSEAMAKADSSQHIQNLKNTFGDIKQQIGGIIEYNIAPLLANMDNGLQTSFSNITKIINYTGAVIANFPGVAKQSLSLVGSMLNTVFSWDFVSASITRFLAFDDSDREMMKQRLDVLRREQDGMLLISFPGDEKSSGGCLAAGRGFFHINAFGCAEPCPFSAYSDTNIRETGVRNALKSPLFKALNDKDIMNADHIGGCVLFEKKELVEELCKVFFI